MSGAYRAAFQTIPPTVPNGCRIEIRRFFLGCCVCLRPAIVLALLGLAACGYKLERIPRTYIPQPNGLEKVDGHTCPTTVQDVRALTSLAVSADGIWFAATDLHGHATLYRLNTGQGSKLCYDLKVAPSQILASGDSRLLMTDRWGGVTLIQDDPTTLTLVHLVSARRSGNSLLRNSPVVFAFVGDGKIYVRDGIDPVVESSPLMDSSWADLAMDVDAGCDPPVSPYLVQNFSSDRDGKAFYGVSKCGHQWALLTSTNFQSWRRLMVLDVASADHADIINLDRVPSGQLVAHFANDDGSQQAVAIDSEARTARRFSGNKTPNVIAVDGPGLLTASLRNGQVMIGRFSDATSWAPVGNAVGASCADYRAAASISPKEIVVLCWRLRPSGDWTRTFTSYRSEDGGVTWSGY